MRKSIFILLVLVSLPIALHARVVVFWQPGFPTVASQPLDRPTLEQALAGLEPVFADESALARPETLRAAGLFILPYGSAVPVQSWKAIEAYLNAGGNLLILGGQPLRVPVARESGQYIAGAPQDTWSRTLGFRHTYEVPVPAGAAFQWRSGYTWLPAIKVQAQTYFTVEGRMNGLGYMADSTGLLVAAPVIVSDHANSGAEQMPGTRIVALDFNPTPGYWQSPDGTNLIHQTADYASQGAVTFSVEALFSALRSGEPPVLTVHLRDSHSQSQGYAFDGQVEFTLTSDSAVVNSATLPFTSKGVIDLDAPLHSPLPPGFYTVTAVLKQQGKPREFYQNGFWVSGESALESGNALGVKGDFLTLGGKPFFPVGTNYFSTEENGWDFSGPRNAAVWDHDFAEMASHGVSFVRTGVWMQNSKFIEDETGGVNLRFTRNLEAFLLCAQRHNIAVNFTLFAFSPHSGPQRSDPSATPLNPYTDLAAVAAQHAYVRSITDHFKGVPWLSWDLINEPSFSNPRMIFRGNVPNADPSEAAAWHKWLSARYTSLADLAAAWRVTPESLGTFDAVPLPTLADLRYERYGNPNEIRTLDYNLFAQDTYSGWVRSLVALIRSTGSNQLINVGQDEGGVIDRVLNQFYGGAGVSFTTNHTYWQDEALLWDSVVARRPGVPNITGETGYQPVWASDGTWRYDEFTGLGLTERKWVLGFAAGSSGAMQWDWDREVDFGMLRSDGSSKVWENRMRDLGHFAQAASSFATSLIEPQVALVLPQSYQLSVYNADAIQAQQAAVRVLFQFNRAQAYSVGEYQPELLGSPKLILLPSPMVLTDSAWDAILTRVKAGAVLLVSGPLDDAHFHVSNRGQALGLESSTVALTTRQNLVTLAGKQELLTYSGLKTTTLSRTALFSGAEWAEVPLGKGRILFSALPLELNDNPQAIADVYAYALKAAAVNPVFTTPITDSGILICPTRFPTATLYALASESNQTAISFTDLRSGKTFSGSLAPGHAALLLVGTDGHLITSYDWPGQ
jgi:hypothetical protein